MFRGMNTEENQMYNLYPFQVEAQNDLTTAATNGARRLLLQCPTGGGKTLIASKIIAHASSQNFGVLVLAHRRELIWQTIEKLKGFGVEAGVIMSGEIHDPTMRVQVASIQSLHSFAIRRGKINFPRADLVVVDEAHGLSGSKSWRRILDEYKDAIILGLTATPISRGGVGLGELFDEMIKCPTIQELIDQGYLAKPKYIIPSMPDLKGLHVRAGDYVEEEIANLMDQPKLVGGVIENWIKYASGRKTIVFACSIKHSINIVEGFKAIGIKAAHIDGDFKNDERDKITEDFRNGDLQVLSSCQVFIEGTDFPQASAISFARPTKSLRLMLQAIGRGLRPYPGKENCLILDHSGIYYEFGPVNQDWKWELSYGKGETVNSLMARKKKERIAREILCENCKIIYSGQLECPECHSRPKRHGKEIPTLEAYLVEANCDEVKQIKEPDKKEFYLQLLGYCKKNNKKDGLAYYKFIDRFGCKPEYSWKHLEPIEPGLELLAWVRKQQRTFYWKQKNPELANYIYSNKNKDALA